MVPTIENADAAGPVTPRRCSASADLARAARRASASLGVCPTRTSTTRTACQGHACGLAAPDGGNQHQAKQSDNSLGGDVAHLRDCYGHPTEPHNEGSVQLTCGLGGSKERPQMLGRLKHCAVTGDGAQVLSMQEGVMT